MTSENSRANGALRALPSVNALLERPRLAKLAERYGKTLARRAAQRALDELRANLREAAEAPGREELLARAEVLTARRARESRRSTLQPVVNATGVVIHTNLGRAPLARVAARAAARAAQGYVALEYELDTGRRGSRYVHCERLLCELTGAEAALVVNNNAAALLLALSTTADERAVLVSRGELVEIGGGFRVHEILAKSGARLVEVGATNKTHLSDYERALEQTPGDVGAVLKVHRSNFVQTGFVSDVSLSELATLLRDRDLPLIYDQGTGSLRDLTPLGLPSEWTVGAALEAGATLVTFSGDKLLGGPQAGILVGSRSWIERARKNPLTRALRVDKLSLAALEATLQLHRDADRSGAIPVLELLQRSAGELREFARRLGSELRGLESLDVEVVETTARVGGGSLPGAELAGVGVALRHRALSADHLERALRGGVTPVIARIVDDRLLLDLRSVPAGMLPRLARLVRRAVERVEKATRTPGAARPGEASSTLTPRPTRAKARSNERST